MKLAIFLLWHQCQLIVLYWWLHFIDVLIDKLVCYIYILHLQSFQSFYNLYESAPWREHFKVRVNDWVNFRNKLNGYGIGKYSTFMQCTFYFIVVSVRVRKKVSFPRRCFINEHNITQLGTTITQLGYFLDNQYKYLPKISLSHRY